MRIPRPNAETQKKQIEDIVQLRSQANVGDTWYIISNKWFSDWESYVKDYNESGESSVEPPGPIDNLPVLGEGESLKVGAQEYMDYALLPEEAWNLLQQWYTGGPALPRKVIKLNNRTHSTVEVRLLNVHFSHKEKGTTTKSISKADTIGEIKKQICEQWGLDANAMRVFSHHNALREEVRDDAKQAAELHIGDGHKIEVENDKMTICDPDADTPSSSSSSSSSSGYATITYPSSSSSSSSSYSPYSSYSYHSYDAKPDSPGLTGLNNLGNTCFMNSSLQCLSNTVPLMEFFLSNAWQRDVNVDNPLGSKGLLAEAFARLVKEIWNGQHRAVAPREFKSRLEDFAPQFSGYQQHDSQELLAFLLDGLHEDLNRVKKKLYAAPREGDDIPDEVRAKEAWEIHQNRNDSVIVDWFQASLKSTLVCPTCARVSVTFDPFMYLSLPLPMKTERSIPLTLIPRDASHPITKFLVKVPKNSTMATLKAKLGEMTGIAPECFLLTDVFNNKFFKKFADHDTIDSFDEERDVMYAHEVLPQPSEGPPYTYCAIYNRKDDVRNTHFTTTQYNTQLFGTPFFVSVPSGATYDELYNIIKASVRRWLRPEKEIPVGDADSDDEPSLPRSGGDGQAETSSEDDSDDSVKRDAMSEEEEETEEDSNAAKVPKHSAEHKPRMFSLIAMDAHAYHETQLHDNDGPLDLDNRSTIAIHWKPAYLDSFEDFKFAAKHSSMNVAEIAESEITLDKCLSLYTTTERLGPDDPWYCNRCKEHRQATKKFDLWNCPRILVVHLKRFSYRNKYFREKLETLVTYPLKGLDLTNHIIGPRTPAPIYDLYAVSNHYGSLGGGHYTAYALNKSTEKWYKFDDSSVSEVDESHVISSSAYVLFYRRRDTYEISAIPADLTLPAEQTTTPNEEESVSNRNTESVSNGNTESASNGAGESATPITASSSSMDLD